MKIKIPIFAISNDGGDGSHTVYLYNNQEELLKNHYLAKDGQLTHEQKQAILTEDDPHENGHISKGEIEIELLFEDQKAQLSKIVSLSFG